MKALFIAIFIISSFLLIAGVILTLANFVKLGAILLAFGAIVGLGNRLIAELHEKRDSKQR